MLLELHGDSQARVDVAPYENLPEGPGSEAFMSAVAVGDERGGHGRSCCEQWGRGGLSDARRRRPGPPYGLFLFFGLSRMKLQGALRGGAAGLSCGLAARDGQKRASRVHTGLWRTGIWPSGVHRLLG